MYDVQDVAEYVITYSEVKDYGISNLKLQKILLSDSGIFPDTYQKAMLFRRY